MQPLFLNMLTENNFVSHPLVLFIHFSFAANTGCWCLQYPNTKCFLLFTKVQIFLAGIWPLVWLFFDFMSAVWFFCTKALLVMFHSEISWPKKNSLYIPFTRTRADIQDGLLLCVCVCVSECARAPAAYSIHQPSWSVYTLYLVLHPLVIICSIPRSRQSRGKRREGLPAVMLQAKIFVTRSPVAVPSSVSQSLSFPLQLPPLSPSRASAHGCCSKR